MAKQSKTPVPSKGRDLSIEEKIAIAEKVCELYATDQYTIAVCLAQNGIRSEATWHKWRAEIEEIEELYINAQKEKHANYKASLVNRARTTLERHLEGFVLETIEEEAEPVINPKTNETTYVTTRIKRKQLHGKPSLQAAMYVLNNMDGQNFTQRPEPYKSGNEKIPTKIQFEILGGSMPPVTNEDDIAEIEDTRGSR